MINNYAKNHLLPPPVKKKYTREHLVMLIFIYYSKGLLSINDIQTMLGPLTDRYFDSDGSIDLCSIYDEVFSMEEEKRRELDYRTSTVISPMFGVQEKKEEKPGRRQSKKPAEPEKIPDLADIQSSSKSVLGTVFSPLYGDKDASDNIPHDDIDPAVADLSVEDFIEEKKVEKPVEKVTEIIEEPVREKLADRPDLIVSPFGVKENPNREKLNDDQYYENISLFDLEDK
jgi:hypothetical protein